MGCVCSRQCLPPGEVSAQGGVCSGGCLIPGGVCSGGVSAPGGSTSWGVSAPRGVCLPGGVCLQGVSAPALGGCIPACTEADPPVDRHTLVKILPWPNFVAAGKNTHISNSR